MTRKSFRELVSSTEAGPERRARQAARRHAIETALALGQLRESLERSHSHGTEPSTAADGSIARLERPDDLYLATLKYYVALLGGRLEVAAVFPEATVIIDPGATAAETDDLDPVGERADVPIDAGLPATKDTAHSAEE